MKKSHMFSLVGVGLLTCLGALLATRRSTAEYTDEWYKSLSLEELEREQEIIKSQWCSGKCDFSQAVRLESLLRRFNDEINLRIYGETKTEDYKYPPRREHGWNLYKPD